MAPMMPFQHMADDDLVAVISYLRAQKPVKHEVPPPDWKFMGRMILAIRPAPMGPIVGQKPPKSAPAQSPTVERG